MEKGALLPRRDQRTPYRTVCLPRKQAFAVQRAACGNMHKPEGERSSHIVFFFLQEGKESFFEDVQNSGQKKCQCQENEKFIGELSAVVLGDEFPPELDGSRHGFKFIISLLDRPRWGCFEQSKKNKSVKSKISGQHISGVITLKEKREFWFRVLRLPKEVTVSSLCWTCCAIMRLMLMRFSVMSLDVWAKLSFVFFLQNRNRMLINAHRALDLVRKKRTKSILTVVSRNHLGLQEVPASPCCL